jgi:hypothetical protein
MAVTPNRVTVSTTAAQITTTPTDRYEGHGGMLIAQASGTLILGGTSALTSGNGARIPVVSGTVIPYSLNYGEAVWAIVASGTLAVDVLEQGI